MSKFYEGQKVVCINDNFPIKSTTETDKSIVGTLPAIHPQVGETLIIDEMLGDEWLRFDKYDFESFNWWHCSRFRPLDEFEVTTIMATKNEIVKLKIGDIISYKCDNNPITINQIFTKDEYPESYGCKDNCITINGLDWYFDEIEILRFV